MPPFVASLTACHDLPRTQIARVDRSDSAFFSRLRELALIDIDGHDHRVIRGSDLYCGEPNAAAAVNGEPLTGLYASAPNNGTVSGHVSAAERRSREGANALRKLDAIEVRCAISQVLRPPAKSLNPRHDRSRCRIGSDNHCVHFRAGFRRTRERECHPVNDFDGANVAANLLNDPADLRGRYWLAA